MFAVTTAFPATAASELEAGFRHPPDSARPWVNWFWMDGNISKEGITADLEAMQRVGIGGALLMDVSQRIPQGPVRFASDEWFALFNHAVSEASRLGLKISINNGPGWTGSGGPWVTPELAMQQLVWSKTNVLGPSKHDGPLPKLEPVKGYERDIATLAFPALAGDGAPIPGFAPKITASVDFGERASNLIDHNTNTSVSFPPPRKGKTHYVQLEFAEPFTAQRLVLTTGVTNQTVSGELQVSDNGKSFRKVREFVIRRPVLTLEFEEVSAKYFRVLFADMEPAAPIQISEVELMPLYRIQMFQVKSGMGRGVWPPLRHTNASAWAVVQRDKVLDLSDKTDRLGRLVWDVPAGQWTIIRFGHVPVGTTNHPPSAGGLGLECDKLSKAAIEQHFNAFLGRLAAANGSPQSDADRGRERGRAERGFVGTHIDSWEIGYQNWTPDFLAEFRKRRGYDALLFLPAYTGRIVESPEISERFFWDVRRTVADLVADNYAGHLRDLARQRGLNLSIEAYMNGPFDQLQYASRADVPMAEFWTESEDHSRFHTARVMSSAAHTSGKAVVAAEAFTSMPNDGSWQNHPFSLKPLADAALCEGVNHFVFHCYAHQPWLDLRPGMTMGPFGVHYNRNETWWEKSKPWHEYLARCGYLLQSGFFVADVCYLTPEGAYTDPPIRAKLEPPIPEGYNYDFASSEALSRMSVKDGRIVLPEGMSYRVLILPTTDQATPARLRKIKELVQGGATVIGPRPLKSPSLADYPDCDAEVGKLATELWQTAGAETSNSKPQTSKDRKVTEAKSLKRILATAGVAPDFEQTGKNSGDPLRWIHRSVSGTEIYFVANSNARPVSAECAFRVKGLLPEVWHPDSGEIERRAQWKEQEERSVLPLDLDAFGSAFVVFRKSSEGVDRISDFARNAKRDEQHHVNFDEQGRLELVTMDRGAYSARTSSGKMIEWNVTNLPPPIELAGPWEVEFQHERIQRHKTPSKADKQLKPQRREDRGEEASVKFDKLVSWTERKDLEIKYFSGTATYSKKFALPANYLGDNRRVFLDLGEVRVIASIKLNGQDLGTLWKPPFRVEVTGEIREGENTLEIEVVNLWPNRLIGDEQLPDDCDWQPYEQGGGCGLVKWPAWTGGETLSFNPETLKARSSGRQAFSTWKYWKKDSPLLESGLIGPVRVIVGEQLTH